MPSKSVEELLREKKISEIVNPRLVQASPEITVTRAIQIMQENKAGYIILARNKKTVGIFTETDVVRKVLGTNADWNRPVSDFMTSNPTVLRLEDSIGKAIDTMGERYFYHVPLVSDSGELVNVISVRTLIRFLAEFYPKEIYNLPPHPGQVMRTPEGG